MLAAVLGLVIGCGGDSETLGPVTITSANAQLIAQQGVGAVDTLTQMSAMVEDYSDVFDNPGAQILPCDTGDANLDISDVGDPGLSINDSARFTFVNCVNGADSIPVTMNGTLEFTVDDVTGTPPGPFSYALTCTFTNFSISLLGATVTVNGGFTLELSTDDADTYTAVVHGDYYSVYAQAGQQSYWGTISNFRLERTVRESTGAYMVNLMATVSGSQIGGEATYETMVPFTGSDPADPDAGMLVVTGAGGATATLIAVDNVNVQILLDLDGDQTTDATIDTTWDVLNDS
jgi:hypothetical protein